MRIVIVGSGAMGSLFGGLLAAAGEDVTLVDIREEHVRRIRDEGLTIARPDGSEVVVRVPATTDPGSLDQPDLAVVFVKSIHTDAALEGAAPILTDDVDVLTLQNGLGNPETIAGHVPERNVVAGVTAHGSTLEGPGRVFHAGEGETTIGRYFSGNDARVGEIAARFTDAGLETTVSDAIRDDVWEKVIVNVGINASTALARVPNGLLASTDPGRRLVESAVEEAAAVARADDRDVRDDVVAHVVEVAEATGSNRSSMLQDVEAGRRTEIERLHGAIVERAGRHDVPVPVIRTLADLVRLAEHGMDADRGSDGD